MMTVAALMQAHPETVSADLPVTMLERRFLDSGFSGFPVVDDDRLIGVVSRYDIVRSLITERSHAEQISEFYSTTRPICAEDEIKSLEATAAQVGVRIAKLRVEDVMTRTVISIDVSESIQGLASLMLEGHLHRLPVVEHGRLVGVVTTMDLVRAVAEMRLAERPDAGDELRILPSRSQ